jgi:hypothetical protein
MISSLKRIVSIAPIPKGVVRAVVVVSMNPTLEALGL